MSEQPDLNDFGDRTRATDESGIASDLSKEERQFGPFSLSTPGIWTAERLGELKVLFTRGKQPTYAEEGVPVLNQECIYWDGWHFDNIRYLDEEEADTWKEKYFPNKGDVIVNSTGKGTLGRALVYPDEERRAVDSHLTIVRTKSELHPYFHRYFLESHLGQALLYSICVNGSTGQIELSKTRLDLLPVPIPPMEEQIKIAGILSNLDDLVETTRDLIQQTQRVKRGVAQELFTDGVGDGDDFQSTPVGRISKTWEVVSIGDVVEMVQYGISESLQQEGEYRIFRMNNMENGYMIGEPMKYIDLDDEEFEKYRVEQEDILFNRTNSHELVGKTGIFELEGDYVFASYLIRLRANEKVDPYYLNYYMNTEAAQNRMEAFATRGVSQSNINATNIQKVKLPLPPMEEQKEIAEIIRSFDEQIETNKQYKQQLQRLKRGLMQDLLTGEVRTTDADIEIPEEVTAYG